MLVVYAFGRIVLAIVGNITVLAFIEILWSCIGVYFKKRASISIRRFRNDVSVHFVGFSIHVRPHELEMINFGHEAFANA